MPSNAVTRVKSGVLITGLSLGFWFVNCRAALAAEPAQDPVFKTEHMWDAKVTIANPIVLGESTSRPTAIPASAP